MDCDSRLQNGLVELRALIASDTSLRVPKDDEFLLKFLRARDVNVDKAFKTVVNYLAMRKGFPDFYPSAVLHVLSSGMVTVLKHRDPDGRQIFFFRTKLWDTSKASADEVFVACTLILEEMAENEETLKNGIIFLHDHLGMAFTHCTQLGIYEIKRMYKIKGGFPLKFKAGYAVNQPMVFRILYNMVYPSLSKKMQQRAHIFGSDLKGLHKKLPPGILPLSLKGELGDADALDHDLIKRLIDRDSYHRTTSKIICDGC